MERRIIEEYAVEHGPTEYRSPACDTTVSKGEQKMRPLFSHLLPAICAALILGTASVPTASAPPATVQTTHKRALLIGISDYHTANDSGYFPSLDCDADVQRIQAALVATFKFDPKRDITTLSTPAQTRKQAILDALTTLVAETGPGDLVYIHYSGHGDQIPDPTEPTGLDSTIVPCDYKTPAPDPKLHGAEAETAWNEISGKTILGYIHRLQAKHPAQIVLSFDSCHSASIARGAEVKTRGSSYRDYVQWYNDNFHTNYSAATPTDTLPADTPDPKSRGGRMIVRGPAWQDLAGTGYVVISACRNESEAKECHDQETNVDMGRLSYCLSRVLMQATPETTYQQVYDDVSALFHEKFSDQEPQLDGNPDTTLFGGTAVPPPPSIQVRVDSPGHYSLAAGRLQGMTRGSEFALYAAHATAFTPAARIGTAKISAVDLTTAILELTDKAGLGTDPDKALAAAQAVETQHNYRKPPLSLDADSLRRQFPAEAQAILDKIAESGLVTTTLLPGQKDYDLKIAPPTRGANSAPTLVRADTGYPLLPLEESRGDLDTAVSDAIKQEARYRYACGLGVGQRGLNPAYRISIRIRPVETELDDDGLPAIKSVGKPLGPNDHLQVGQYFVIEVQNNSARPLHLAILDLESDGKVTLRWPYADKTDINTNINTYHRDTRQDDNVLEPTKPGEWVRLWIGSDKTNIFTPHAKTPDAGEIYKALATDEYVDYTPMATTRGGGQSPFAPLFAPALQDIARGTDAGDIDPGRWTAATETFEIDEPSTP
jgi:hypothetical protein